MNRKWITGITLASVAGTGGAAYAGVAIGHDAEAAPAALSAPKADEGQTGQARTISYQVGSAGSVTITVAGNSLTVSGATADANWVVLSAATPGPHVEVKFTDALQLQIVTFAADLVNGKVFVSLANVSGPDAPTTTASATPMTITVIASAPAASATKIPEPKPATPAPQAETTMAPPAEASGRPAPPAPTTQLPPLAPPAPSSTTAPSGSQPTDDEATDDEATDDEGNEVEDQAPAQGGADHDEEQGDD